MALGSTQSLVKMSTRNIPGGKGGRCVRLTKSPPSCAECLEIWEPKTPGTLWATPGLLRDCFTFTFTKSKPQKNVIEVRTKNPREISLFPPQFSNMCSNMTNDDFFQTSLSDRLFQIGHIGWFHVKDVRSTLFYQCLL